MPFASTAGSSNVASLLGRRSVTYVEQRPSNLLVLPTTHIGVEMELEAAVNGRNPLNLYEEDYDGRFPLLRAVHDGSLRNGIELVFSEPLFGESAINAVNDMYTVRNEMGLGGSVRTSTHVHVNYSDRNDTARTMQSMIAAFLLIERSMCVTAGAHREHNTFCVPTYLMSPANERLYYDLVSTDNEGRMVANLQTLGNDNNRYASMNFASMFRHGSIEYRQLGTVNQEQLILWINLLLSLKKCGLENETSAVLDGPSDLDTFVERMLGVHALNCLVIDDEGRNYFRTVRDRLRAFSRGPTASVTAGTRTVSWSDAVANAQEATMHISPRATASGRVLSAANTWVSTADAPSYDDPFGDRAVPAPDVSTEAPPVLPNATVMGYRDNVLNSNLRAAVDAFMLMTPAGIRAAIEWSRMQPPSSLSNRYGHACNYVVRNMLGYTGDLMGYERRYDPINTVRAHLAIVERMTQLGIRD
jgi:hypothetical protein